jgi:hypothetical protein
MKRDGHHRWRPWPCDGTADEAAPATSGLKTLGLPGHRVTVAQRLAMAQDQQSEAAAQRAAMHHWTETEVLRFIEAFEAGRPDQFAEYLTQEIERCQIDPDLGLLMDRFAASMFPQVSPIDLIALKRAVRLHTRRSLHLKWEGWENSDV